jgi:hypothetical protein
MLLEQLALAHFSMGLLSCKTANAGKVEAVGVYASAAARLMAEFRRSALALQAYRHAARQLAHDPRNDLVIPSAGIDLSDDPPEKNCINDEQAANTEEPDENETIIPYPEPTASGDRTPQSTEGAEDHPRRSRKAPRRRSNEPAVGAVHRAANS